MMGAARTFAALGAAGLLLASSGAEAEGLTIGVGGSVDLGTGILDIGQGDLEVAGTFSAGTEGFDVRHVDIQSGGVLNGDSALLQVCGDWSNSGTFNPGTGTVALVDGCLATAIVSGNTTFGNLDISTTSGRQINFAAFSTQTVTGTLSLLGTVGNLLVLRGSGGGTEPFIDVQGTGGGDFVDVDDIDASAGSPIILGPNSVKGSNTPGWELLSAAVPALGLLGVVILMLLMAGGGSRALARRRETIVAS